MMISSHPWQRGLTICGNLCGYETCFAVSGLARESGASGTTAMNSSEHSQPSDGLDRNVRAYYDRGNEGARLGRGTGLLEFARTKELIERHLPEGELDVLDVGGGPGVYAHWLSELGHRVTLVDPVPLHVQQARERDARIVAIVGDARDVPVAGASADVVLMLGPLYHLTDPQDRMRALAEATRCLRPGGTLMAAVISRYAALFDLLIRLDRLHEEGIADTVATAMRTGRFAGTTGSLFTTAYFHLPEEIVGEVAGAGLANPRVFNIEGPGAFTHDLDERWADEDRRQVLLDAARLVEEDPRLMAASSHLLVVARTASGMPRP